MVLEWLKKQYNQVVKSTSLILITTIFLLAILIRFLYFPNNINFAYDQARDSFTSLDILKGDFKILGPPTTAGDKIFHGALVYYVLAPIYFFTDNNPEAAAAIFRIINALGVFLVFYIGTIIFNKQVGIVSALFFAISFEQSQFSLFFGHPALGVFTILIFYLGLAMWIFRDNPKGFIIALAGLGLTIQFEDANIPLILLLIIFMLFFHQKLKLLSLKTFIIGVSVFLLSISTFILAEIKYSFRMSEAIIDIILKMNGSPSAHGNLFKVMGRFVNDNILSIQTLVPLILLIICVSIIVLIKQKTWKKQIIFLSLWFFGGLSTHILNPNFTYYYSPGAAVGLLILVAFLIYSIYQKQKILAVLMLTTIILSNMFSIINENIKGPNSDIVIQSGMLTRDQRYILDYIYEKSNKENFSVNALTVPLNIKTTWDYQFTWYGKNKYGYLPVWGGVAADGYKGYLDVVSDRSKLPAKRFTIIEPTVGIGVEHIEEFFRIENYFTKVIEEKRFGAITVQTREPF